MPEATKDRVKLHGSTVPRQWLEQMIGRCCETTWKRATYQRRDALFTRDGIQCRLYVGEDYDPEREELRVGGWTHDHCALCTWSLGEDEDPERGIGYTNGTDWLCTECFQRFIQPYQRAKRRLTRRCTGRECSR
jgi:hypothetical protein